MGLAVQISPGMLYPDLSSGFTQPPVASAQNYLQPQPHLLQPHSPPRTDATSREAPWPQSKASGQGEGADSLGQAGGGKCTPKGDSLVFCWNRCNQFAEENHILFSLFLAQNAWYLINPGASPEGDWLLRAPGSPPSPLPQAEGLTCWLLIGGRIVGVLSSQPSLP